MLSQDERLTSLPAFGGSKFVPVASFDKADDAVKTADILVRHNIPVLEVTLRTPEAVECIRAVIERFPGMHVGAGSVLSVESCALALKAGARFAVAPSLDLKIMRYAMDNGVVFVPGVATPSELHAALTGGAEIIKVFPAKELGGPAYLKAIVAPFQMLRFNLVPTGGIDAGNLVDYLKTERVIACGATFPVHSSLLKDGNFAEIENRVIAFKNLCDTVY